MLEDFLLPPSNACSFVARSWIFLWNPLWNLSFGHSCLFVDVLGNWFCSTIAWFHSADEYSWWVPDSICFYPQQTTPAFADCKFAWLDFDFSNSRSHSKVSNFCFSPSIILVHIEPYQVTPVRFFLPKISLTIAWPRTSFVSRAPQFSFDKTSRSALGQKSHSADFAHCDLQLQLFLWYSQLSLSFRIPPWSLISLWGQALHWQCSAVWLFVRSGFQSLFLFRSNSLIIVWLSLHWVHSFGNS